MMKTKQELEWQMDREIKAIETIANGYGFSQEWADRYIKDVEERYTKLMEEAEA